MNNNPYQQHSKIKNLTKKIFIDKNNNFLIQAIRYFFVGGIAFIADYGTYTLLASIIKIYYLIATIIAITIGLTINYIISILWVFDKRLIKNQFLEFISFAVIGLIGLGFNVLLLWFFTEKMHIYHQISKLMASAIVLSWNFLARKFLLFR